MSEKWETVGKTKPAVKSAGGKSAANGSGAKKVIKPLPRLEDVLPKNSLENVYSAAFDLPPSPKASPKKEKKEPTKTDAAKKAAAKKEEKPRGPTTLQEAVKANLRLDDLKQLIEASQQKFPDSPVLWLRDVAAYLNLKLTFEPAAAAGGDATLDDFDCLGDLPLSALSQNMRKLIFGMLNSCSAALRETFIETCIANTAHELAKGLTNVVGWRILTQALADIDPRLIIASLPRFIELRNSYMNRPAIGLAILWSVGQAGRKDLGCGVRIWLEMMLPQLQMRHYTRFVVEYMARLLAQYDVTPDSQLDKPVMDISNFCTVQDTVFLVGGQINKESGRLLRSLYPSLRAIAVAGCSNHELFPRLMDRMTNIHMPDQVLDTLSVLAGCLGATPAALVHWRRLYTTHLSQSGQLLQYLADNWSVCRDGLETQEFEETLEVFQEYNLSASHKEDIGLCIDGCAAVASKLKRRGGAWFPWKSLSFLLLIATAAVINLDVKKAGSFKKSYMGAFLSDVGQYERSVMVWEKASSAYLAGEGWVGTNLPLLHDKVKPKVDSLVIVLQEYGSHGLGIVQQGLAGVKSQVPQVQRKAAQLTALLGNAANQLIEGKVDWDKVRLSILEKATTAQEALSRFGDWLRAQIDQLLK